MSIDLKFCAQVPSPGRHLDLEWNEATCLTKDWLIWHGFSNWVNVDKEVGLACCQSPRPGKKFFAT